MPGPKTQPPWRTRPKACLDYTNSYRMVWEREPDLPIYNVIASHESIHLAT